MNAEIIKQMMKLIYRAIDDRLDNTPQIVSGIVDSINQDGSANVHIPPDLTIFSNIPNQTPFPLFENDCVKLIKDKGKASNMWITAKCGETSCSYNIFPVGTLLTYSNDTIDPNIKLGPEWKRIGTQNIEGQDYYVWQRTQ